MRQSTVQYCNVAPKSDTQTAKNTPNDVQRLSILHKCGILEVQ